VSFASHFTNLQEFDIFLEPSQPGDKAIDLTCLEDVTFPALKIATIGLPVMRRASEERAYNDAAIAALSVFFQHHPQLASLVFIFGRDKISETVFDEKQVRSFCAHLPKALNKLDINQITLSSAAAISHLLDSLSRRLTGTGAEMAFGISVCDLQHTITSLCALPAGAIDQITLIVQIPDPTCSWRGKRMEADVVAQHRTTLEAALLYTKISLISKGWERESRRAEPRIHWLDKT
jgi:hypothetical protein